MSEIKRRPGRPKKTDKAITVQSAELNDEDVKKVVRKRKLRDYQENFGADMAEPGDNTRFLRFALASWNLPPIDISDPKQVEERLLCYFQHCEDNDRKPNVVGMANWLGVSRDTLNSWKRGEFRADTHSEIIKRAFAIIEEQWVDYMLNGKVNPAAGIFIGKNHLQYTDAQQIVVTPQNPYDQENPDNVRDKYIDGMKNEIQTDGSVE